MARRVICWPSRLSSDPSGSSPRSITSMREVSQWPWLAAGTGAEVYLTLNSKNNPTYADPRNQVVDANVRMKQEEDWTILPHYYCDLEDIRRLLSEFSIVKLRQI